MKFPISRTLFPDLPLSFLQFCMYTLHALTALCLPAATSREVSPQSRGGYVAHITGGYTAYAGATTPGAERRAIGRSRIPRSQGASREGSPSRQASDRAYASIQRRSSGRSSMRSNRSE